MNIDWKRKLCSRKLCTAVIGLVTSLVLIFGGTQEQASLISGVVLQAATVLAYCIGEGLADGSDSMIGGGTNGSGK